MQIELALEQPLSHLSVGRLGRETTDQVRGPFVEGSRRLPVGGAFDPAVRRIGGILRHSGALERERAHPHAVPVPVGQVHTPAGYDCVEQLLHGCSAREGVHRPTSPEDPFTFGVRLGVGLDGEQVVLLRRQIVQVALEHVEPAAHRVHVGVLEAGNQHASREVDDIGGRADVGPDVGVGAHRDDAAAAHRDGSSPRASRVDRVDRTVHERNVG